MPAVQTRLVSVVLVNFRGADDTVEAIRQLRNLDWPQNLLEIVVVENGSGDDSAERIRTAAPDVLLIESQQNHGFAGGCNLGVRESSGEFVAFLNNDAKPDSAWVRAAVARFAESPKVGAVASRVLDWDGASVDFIGSALTWYGMGYKPLTGEPVPKRYTEPDDVLFGTGSAMFVRRTVFDTLGGFDESYFMFFEDVDLGWRLNLMGWRYAYEPKSLAYHKHHASMESYGSHKETYLLERNALYTLYKNLEQASLDETLPAAMALSVRRAVSRGTLDSQAFDLRRGDPDSEPTLGVAKVTMSAVFAIDQFVEQLPVLRESRAVVQASRVVSDSRIWRLFGTADAPVYQDENYLRGYENIVTTFNVTEPPATSHVLIITGDPIGEKMAGPAIRAWHMAHALADDNDVTLVSLSGVEPLDATFDMVHVRPGDDRAFGKLESWADVIIFQGHAMALFDSLRRSDKIVVVDIYDPMHLEQLEQARELPRATWDKQVRDATAVLNEQLERGDYFLCASERQRHFYLGQLAALGRLSPATYETDPDLTRLLSVVPFGLSTTPPVHERAALKGVVPGIGENDKVLLWSGGLYNWFDPKTLIRAVALLSERRDDVRLFFQGAKHPHPDVPEMGIVSESRALAAELGVLDSSVFFNSSWVDYNDRQNYLTEADAGVSTHHSHIETTFSFRTRILDYLWAGLPMVVTEGDHFAELVDTEGLGVVVPARDVAGLADALERVLYDEAFAAESRSNVQRVRGSYRWDRVLQPLVDFVADPQPARDRIGSEGAGVRRKGSRPPRGRTPHGLRHDLGLVVHYLRNGGVALVARKVKSRIRGRR